MNQLTILKRTTSNGCRLKVIKYADVIKEHWYDEEGRYHRENGLPAYVCTDGVESYWKHGSLMSERNVDGVLRVYRTAFSKDEK